MHYLLVSNSNFFQLFLWNNKFLMLKCYKLHTKWNFIDLFVNKQFYYILKKNLLMFEHLKQKTKERALTSENFVWVIKENLNFEINFIYMIIVYHLLLILWIVIKIEKKKYIEKYSVCLYKNNVLHLCFVVFYMNLCVIEIYFEEFLRILFFFLKCFFDVLLEKLVTTILLLKKLILFIGYCL